MRAELKRATNGGSIEPFCPRAHRTQPDYPAYVRWCQRSGTVPQAREPLAYGPLPVSYPGELELLREMSVKRPPVPVDWNFPMWTKR
jgi:hypothetical protein